MVDNTSYDFNIRAQPEDTAAGGATPPPPEIDLAPYLDELVECGMNEAQATEFLATLVPLLWHFVDTGFRVDISELLLSWVDGEAVESGKTAESEAAKA